MRKTMRISLLTKANNGKSIISGHHVRIHLPHTNHCRNIHFWFQNKALSIQMGKKPIEALLTSPWR